MGGGLHILPSGLSASGAAATSKTSTNSRVSTAAGYVSIATDIVSFPGPATVGNWLVTNQRVSIGGTPSVGQGSSGQATVPGPPPATVPMTIVSVDARASGS
ncbi:MAG TPA: hypothetical protein VD846_11630 [Allosphingosinicella sp.]|nr:hypothetical protein [Allosphingosinicella sp.]